MGDVVEERSWILCIDASIPIGLLLASRTNKIFSALYAPRFPAAKEKANWLKGSGRRREEEEEEEEGGEGEGRWIPQ